MPTTTAAVLTRHGGPDALQIRDDWQVADPRPGQVLLRVTAAGVNNTDLWTREGAYGRAGDPDATSGWRGPVAFPRVQGGDVAGVVESVGESTTGELVGRRVLVDPATYADDSPDAAVVAVLGSESDGGFSGYVVVGADKIHDVTESPLTDEELASLPIAYGTATGMLHRAGLRAGETVLVTGASGGVGTALVQLAAAMGARVVAVTTAAKAESVSRAGADHVVTRDRGSPADLTAQVASAIPDGPQVVADVVGGTGLTELLPLLADGGRWVIAGAIAGPVVPLDLRRLYLHNRRLVGSTMHTRQQFAVLVDMARRGDVRPLIATRYPLREIHRAQAAFASAAHVGKIVLRP